MIIGWLSWLGVLGVCVAGGFSTVYGIGRGGWFGRGVSTGSGRCVILGELVWIGVCVWI